MIQVRTYELETVTVNSKGAITSRRKGQYYVENTKGVGLEMVEIPGGSFTMGSVGSLTSLSRCCLISFRASILLICLEQRQS